MSKWKQFEDDAGDEYKPFPTEVLPIKKTVMPTVEKWDIQFNTHVCFFTWLYRDDGCALPDWVLKCAICGKIKETSPRKPE